jgi:competence protein ComGC
MKEFIWSAFMGKKGLTAMEIFIVFLVLSVILLIGYGMLHLMEQ